MIIKKLMPFVTSFSEAIMTKYNHGEEVCVGGEVKHVIDMSQFLSEEDLADPLKDPGIYITLDDGVGLNYIVTPKQGYYKFIDDHGVLEGQVILAVGKVMDLPMRGKKREYLDHPEKTKRVAAYHLCLVPDAQDSSTIV
jgi:hypothetical protein